uniref:F-box domain-containing protein n=1 Tax=Tanacetum cinerariifolium TaxID=118510 RepID=A0A699IF33_TANCI|nr:hypothetical protein [Tanacetum cinerariifolium]
MLPELLNMIARRIFYEDYFSFAGVCKSWRSAVVHDDHTNGPPSRFPSLLLAEKKKDGREFGELFNDSNKSIRKIRLPESYGKVCRSSCGWLITVGCDHATQLLYPLSRETINLPEINIFPEFMVNLRWKESIKSKWTTVGCSSLTCDITYYNKKVYTFDKVYRIRACDVHGDDPTTLVDVSSLTTNLYDHYMQGLTWGAHIVGLDVGHKRRLLVLDDLMAQDCLWVSGPLESLELLEWHEGIRKLLIVTNYPSSLKVPLVVVLWGCFNKMGFCRPGDNKWTTVGCSDLTCDITYYNGQVYTFDEDYRIQACDVHGNDPTTLVYVSRLTGNLYDHKQGLTGGAYIVGMDKARRKGCWWLSNMES